MSSMEMSNITSAALRKMFEKGLRFDGRKLLEHRPIEVSYNVSNMAEGSARVKIGKTEVLAGVKMAPGEPYPDSPDKGNLAVSGDLLPLASPRFETGPPGFPAIELPRLVDRALRDSGIIDFHKLVITPGERVWSIFVDVYPINDDGNLIDAALIAAVAALRKTVMPVLDADGNIDKEKKPKEALPIDKNVIPLYVSFYKFGNSIIIDPVREEEEAADSRLCLGLSKWNSHYMINSCQKSGKTPFTRKEMDTIMGILKDKYDELNEKLKKFL